MNEYLNSNLLLIAEKLNCILKKNDLKLINEFEEEFIKLENPNETSTMIIYGNRALIRNAYVVVNILYEENATLNDIHKLINDINGYGKGMVLELSKVNVNNPLIEDKLLCAYYYFLNEYFATMYKRSGEYTYSLPTRYIIDKLIDCLNIKDNKFQYKKIPSLNKNNVIKQTKIKSINNTNIPNNLNLNLDRISNINKEDYNEEDYNEEDDLI